jgi:dimethylaniline monooxygenase (N-oxide forming)
MASIDSQEVCIVGSGITGILSARSSLRQGLIPFILEKSSEIGGLWNIKNSLSVWNSLKANTIKFSSTISDHLWPEDTPEYPSPTEYLSYLQSFIEKNRMTEYFHFNCTVTYIGRLGDDYEVKYTEQGLPQVKIFKYVIIACGLYSKPKENPKGFELFKGTIIHSGYYREPSLFTGKNVVIVGNGFSSGDIAVEALETAKSVKILYKKTHGYIKRKFNGVSFEFDAVSIDFKDAPIPILTNLFCNSMMVSEIIKNCGNPGDLHEDWRILPEDIGKNFINVSIQIDDFFKSVQNGQISPIKGKIQEITENSIILEDGQEVPADCIVLGIGYYINLDFLSDEIKEIIKLENKRPKFPFICFRSMIHPNLPRFAFAGYLYTIFPGIYEIMAEVCSQWVSGRLQVTNEELWEGVRLEEENRYLLDEPGWTYEPIGILKDLLRLLGLEINYEMLSELGYSKGPYSPVFYFQNREGQQDLIKDYIRQIKSFYPSFYST